MLDCCLPLTLCVLTKALAKWMTRRDVASSSHVGGCHHLVTIPSFNHAFCKRSSGLGLVSKGIIKGAFLPIWVGSRCLRQDARPLVIFSTVTLATANKVAEEMRIYGTHSLVINVLPDSVYCKWDLTVRAQT
jgi:hypothetical protein